MRNPPLAGRIHQAAQQPLPQLGIDAHSNLLGQSHASTNASTIPFPSAGFPGAPSNPGLGSSGSGIPGVKSLADVEMEYILQVYAKNSLNKQATATELGISLKTLYNKLHKYEEERRMRAG
jgi:DNA-binding NtrC family response regulator